MSCINTGKFHGLPELQVQALMCIYHLVQHGLEGAPLYANWGGPAQWHAYITNTAANADGSNYKTYADTDTNGEFPNDDADSKFPDNNADSKFPDNNSSNNDGYMSNTNSCASGGRSSGANDYNTTKGHHHHPDYYNDNGHEDSTNKDHSDKMLLD